MVSHVRIAGANCKIAEGQEEYQTLHGRRMEVPLGNGEFSHIKVAAIDVAFQLEVEEIRHLLEGGTLILRQLTGGGPYTPISLWVEPSPDPVRMDQSAPITPRD